MKKMLMGLIPVLALTVGLSAQQETKATTKPTVAGTWTMTVMSHQVGMELTQDGTKVMGTMMMMGTDVPVEGEFVDGTLNLTSKARMMNGPPSTDEAAHGAAAPQGGAPLTVKATLQDDGTLAGEMPSPNGRPVTWIAERLKQRKVRPAASSSSSEAAAAAIGMTGAWKMAASSPQGPMQFDLALKQDGEKVTGTLNSAHSGELPLEGTFTGGRLKFSTGGTGPHAMHLDYSAKLKDDGTLAGELTGDKVNMPWTAERVKK
jgi:hypothetical protein